MVLGLAQTFVIIPLIVYRWGKGAYCGWVCPGALAETLGDEYRTRAPHGRTAKKAENIGQGSCGLPRWSPSPVFPGKMGNGLSDEALNGYGSSSIRFLRESSASEPILCSGRIWCRFFMPARGAHAYLCALLPFRIMANKKRCISCAICTSVCHMGIDVMGYANQGIPMNDVECVRCSACIVHCPLQVLTFGSVGSIDPGNTRYRSRPFPLTPGWKSGLPRRHRHSSAGSENKGLNGTMGEFLPEEASKKNGGGFEDNHSPPENRTTRRNNPP